ncbi:MAG TPA: hypothetical protein VG738_13795 [Chitinophagaceae bacterium]|nr:hypothetical protein [Chitinophagaceae bacterium]
MLWIIIGVLMVGTLIIYISGRKNRRAAYSAQLPADQDTIQKGDNIYEEMRNLAFTTNPAQLGLSLPTGNIVYGVVMDWALKEGIATVAAFSTGDVSLYLSSGGGSIGGGQQAMVAQAGKAFVSLAQDYLDKTSKTEATPLPAKNCVRFYLLTNQGIFTAHENANNFKNGSSIWLPLFEEGNKVISALRMVETR